VALAAVSSAAQVLTCRRRWRVKQLVFEFLGISSEVPLKLDPQTEDGLVEAMAAAIEAVVQGRVEKSDERSPFNKQDHS
jgi:hypothetical protein